MKQFLHSYRLFLIVAALCTLAAFWLLGVRIGVEQTQRQVDVVVSYEDVCALSGRIRHPVQDWLTQLADAGARELLVTPQSSPIRISCAPRRMRAWARRRPAALHRAAHTSLPRGMTRLPPPDRPASTPTPSRWRRRRCSTRCAKAAAHSCSLKTGTRPVVSFRMDTRSTGTPAAWSRASGSTRRSARATRRLATAARRRSSICSTVPSWTAA